MAATSKLCPGPHCPILCSTFEANDFQIGGFILTLKETNRLSQKLHQQQNGKCFAYFLSCNRLTSKLCLCLIVFQIVNITMAPKYQEQRLVRQPVDITFTVRTSRGYLMGSEVSNALMKLTMVEFSYYMGFPVLQIAERESYRVVSLYFHLPALHSDP